MASKVDRRGFLSHLNSLLSLHQRPKHTMAGAMRKKKNDGKGSKLQLIPGQDDISKWKRVDASTMGITKSIISPASWRAVKTLHDEGFEAYLVGGCVRDLILKRIPKDFDVITNADLKEVRSAFHRAFIVGRHFPICHVHLKGSMVEVSNFEQVPGHGKKGGGHNFPKLPNGCSKGDYIRWRDAFRRDFTINSLFYDPFANKVYDYTDAMMDLKSLELRTIISAHESFREDCARILRGLRIAARLRLSLSKDIEAAIFKLSPSVASLSESRLVMELNYMLSYGAAEPSLQLLHNYNLLGTLLPFHGAYLNSQSTDSAPPRSLMFMKLFHFLDEVVTCDQPCDPLLWSSLLAFHLALVTRPQEALVVWTFSSVWYYGSWEKAVKAARQHALKEVNFKPEILDFSTHLSDMKLAKEVSSFALSVKKSYFVLSDSKSLLKAMAKAGFPSPQSKVALVSKKQVEKFAQVIDCIVCGMVSDRNLTRSFEIDRALLSKGDIQETRFALGKIIIDTLSSRIGTDEIQVSGKKQELVEEEQKTTSKDQEVVQKPTSSSKKKKPKKKKAPQETPVKEQKRASPSSDAETTPDQIEKQKFIQKEQETVSKEQIVVQNLASPSKKKPKKNNGHVKKSPQETPIKEQKRASPSSDAETTPDQIKKQKFIEKGQETTSKDQKVAQKLASPSKKKPKKNNGHVKKAPQETYVKGQKCASPSSDAETTPDQIKKQEFIKKEQKTTSKDQKVPSSSEKKQKKNDACDKKAPQEMPVKEQKRASPSSDAETTPERLKKQKFNEKEQKKISEEKNVVQKLASPSEKGSSTNKGHGKKSPPETPSKGQNRVTRLSDFFK